MERSFGNILFRDPQAANADHGRSKEGTSTKNEGAASSVPYSHDAQMLFRGTSLRKGGEREAGDALDMIEKLQAAGGDADRFGDRAEDQRGVVKCGRLREKLALLRQTHTSARTIIRPPRISC